MQISVLSIFPELEDSLYQDYFSVRDSLKDDAIDSILEWERYQKRTNLINKIVRESIDTFCRSRNWQAGRKNANTLIYPIVDLLKEEYVNYLLEQAVVQQKEDKYDQLLDCTYIMIRVFEQTIDKFPKTIEYWKYFLEKKRHRNWGEIEQLEQLVKSRDDSNT